MAMGISAKCIECNIEISIGGVRNLKECENMIIECPKCKASLIIKDGQVIKNDNELKNQGIRKGAELKLNKFLKIYIFENEIISEIYTINEEFSEYATNRCNVLLHYMGRFVTSRESGMVKEDIDINYSDKANEFTRTVVLNLIKYKNIMIVADAGEKDLLIKLVGDNFSNEMLINAYSADYCEMFIVNGKLIQNEEMKEYYDMLNFKLIKGEHLCSK